MTGIDDALIGLEPGQDEEFEILAELSEDEKTAWDKIRGQIERREMTLSFSKIKAFSKSPFHFVRYMLARELKRDDGTPAQIFGDLFDCITTTPDETKDRFVIEPVGGGFGSLAAVGILADFYGISFENEKFDERKRIVREHRISLKKRIVTQAQMNQAEALKNRLYRNEVAGRLMNRLTSTQVSVEFSAFGWNWKGKFDGESETEIDDLKLMMQDASFQAAQYNMRKLKYAWQGALYTIGARQGKKKFYNICLDASLGVTVVHINRHELVKAWNQIEECVADFERCIYEGLDDPGIWFSSYDFFAPRNGVYEFGTYNY
jgi:PDDEXK-like domain of unknown function (DUF3799)